MGYCEDAQFSQPFQFGGQYAIRNHPRSRFGNRHCPYVRSDFDFKKSRMNPSVFRSKHSTPYKSEMCLQFQRGKCFYGENCHFSHSRTEIRRPGFNPVVMKMKECRWFSSGEDCPYGERCQFLHKCDRKISMGDDGIGKDQNERWSKMNGGGNSDLLATSKMKLCSKWERFGSCPYGEKCIFAHEKAGHKNTGSPSVVEYGNTPGLQPASEPNSVAATMNNLRLKHTKCFRNWDMEKVCEIYAEWIDVQQSILQPPLH